MIRNNDPVGFIRTAKKAVGVMKDATQHVTPGQKAAWNADRYQNRWKNLAWSLLFTFITGAGVYGFLYPFKRYIATIPWFIVVGLLSILCLLGIIMIGGYLKLIIQGKE